MHLGGELLTIGVLFVIAYVLGRLGKTIGLPAIPIYMVVGLIASPHTPWIGLNVESHTIELIATFGLVLLLFNLGSSSTRRSSTATPASSSSPVARTSPSTWGSASRSGSRSAGAPARP